MPVEDKSSEHRSIKSSLSHNGGLESNCESPSGETIASSKQNSERRDRSPNSNRNNIRNTDEMPDDEEFNRNNSNNINDGNKRPFEATFEVGLNERQNKKLKIESRDHKVEISDAWATQQQHITDQSSGRVDISPAATENNVRPLGTNDTNVETTHAVNCGQGSFENLIRNKEMHGSSVNGHNNTQPTSLNSYPNANMSWHSILAGRQNQDQMQMWSQNTQNREDIYPKIPSNTEDENTLFTKTAEQWQRQAIFHQFILNQSANYQNILQQFRNNTHMSQNPGIQCDVLRSISQVAAAVAGNKEALKSPVNAEQRFETNNHESKSPHTKHQSLSQPYKHAYTPTEISKSRESISPPTDQSAISGRTGHYDNAGSQRQLQKFPIQASIEANQPEPTLPSSLQPLYAQGACQWSQCEHPCPNLASFLEHLNSVHTGTGKSLNDCHYQENYIKRLQRQIEVENQRYKAMLYHINSSSLEDNQPASSSPYHQQQSTEIPRNNDGEVEKLKDAPLYSNNITSVNDRVSSQRPANSNAQRLNVFPSSYSGNSDSTNPLRNPTNPFASSLTALTPHSARPNESQQQPRSSRIGNASTSAGSTFNFQFPNMPVNGSRSQTNNNMDLNSSPGSRSQQLTEDEISMDLRSNSDYYATNHVRPKHTYAQLIRQAIIHTDDRQMTLNEIYNWFQKNFCYFRQNGPTWKSAIRTNLSLHNCFRRCEDVMGSYWTVDDHEFRMGRHLKRGRPRKYDESASGQTSSNNNRIQARGRTRMDSSSNPSPGRFYGQPQMGLQMPFNDHPFTPSFAQQAMFTGLPAIAYSSLMQNVGLSLPGNQSSETGLSSNEYSASGGHRSDVSSLTRANEESAHRHDILSNYYNLCNYANNANMRNLSSSPKSPSDEKPNFVSPSALSHNQSEMRRSSERIVELENNEDSLGESGTMTASVQANTPTSSFSCYPIIRKSSSSEK